MNQCYEYLNKLSILIQHVPDVIWAAVIASCLTLSGVLISNSSNSKRLKLQLQHDASQKEADRKAVIRREVYLELAKEAVLASQYLGTIVDVNASEQNLSKGLDGYFHAAAKAMIIAESNTSIAINELSGFYGVLLFQLMPDLFTISSHINMIKFHQQQYEDSQLEIKRILAAQTAFNEQPPPKNQSVFDMLQLNFKQAAKNAENQTAERQHFSKLKMEAHLQFLKKIMPQFLAINDLQINVIKCIRDELGITTDTDLMQAQVNKMRMQQSDSMGNLIVFLEEKLKEV